MDKKDSLNSKIEKFVKLFADVEREFIPPDLGGGESNTQDGENSPVSQVVTTTDILCECAHEVPWDMWKDIVRGSVISECTSCATNWTPTCDCIAKGAVSRDASPTPWPWPMPGETNSVASTLRNSPFGRILEHCTYQEAFVPCLDDGRRSIRLSKCCSFIRFNGGCFPDGDAFDYVYTKEQWLGSASAPTMNGAWVSYFDRCRQNGYDGETAEEFLANCNDLPGTNCMEQFTQYWTTMWNVCGHQLGTGSYMSIDRGPTKYAKMLFDNCTSAGGACCSPAGDFGGFECSSATNSDSCAGTFHPGKTCQEIGDSNCGGATGGNLLGQNQIDKSVVNEISASLIKALRKKA